MIVSSRILLYEVSRSHQNHQCYSFVRGFASLVGPQPFGPFGTAVFVVGGLMLFDFDKTPAFGPFSDIADLSLQNWDCFRESCPLVWSVC